MPFAAFRFNSVLYCDVLPHQISFILNCIRKPFWIEICITVLHDMLFKSWNFHISGWVFRNDSLSEPETQKLALKYFLFFCLKWRLNNIFILIRTGRIIFFPQKNWHSCCGCRGNDLLWNDFQKALETLRWHYTVKFEAKKISSRSAVIKIFPFVCFLGKWIFHHQFYKHLIGCFERQCFLMCLREISSDKIAPTKDRYLFSEQLF